MCNNIQYILPNHIQKEMFGPSILNILGVFLFYFSWYKHCSYWHVAIVLYVCFLWISFKGIVLTAKVGLNVAHLRTVDKKSTNGERKQLEKESSRRFSRTNYFGRFIKYIVIQSMSYKQATYSSML